jgi:ABC-type nitrate/sulfonate/bicarbonate transport system permease component
MILGLGCALAVALAALTRALDSRVVLNLLVMLSAIPPLVWVPLSLTAFGLRSWAFDIPATLFVAALLAPALLQMAKRIPQGSVEMLVALGVPRSQILRQVLAPHLIHTAAPLVSLSYAVIFGVSAVLEYLGGFNGVGRALRLIAGYAEATDLLILTIVATAMLLLIQATIRLFLRALAAAL